jgi:hypothetical protein
MSLLQDVLRTQTLDSLDKTLAAAHINRDDREDSDDELVNVVCTAVCYSCAYHISLDSKGFCSWHSCQI